MEMYRVYHWRSGSNQVWWKICRGWCNNGGKKFRADSDFIGLTVVAVGTSLPELVTSIVAAKKNEPDMAVGNVVGSNIFNILLVLGVASSISPIAFLMENVVDIVILVGFSIVVWLMAWTKKRLSRREGIIMLLLD